MVYPQDWLQKSRDAPALTETRGVLVSMRTSVELSLVPAVCGMLLHCLDVVELVGWHSLYSLLTQDLGGWSWEQD